MDARQQGRANAGVGLVARAKPHSHVAKILLSTQPGLTQRRKWSCSAMNMGSDFRQREY